MNELGDFMSEEKPPAETPAALPATERAPITMAQLMEFMKDRHVVEECPQCGQNNWSRMPFTPTTGSIDNASGVGLSTLTDTSSMDPAGTYLPMLALLCLNCGYLRQFVWAVVEEWKKGREKDG